MEQLINGLLAIPGLTFYGIKDPAKFDQRTPTVAIRMEGYTPRELATRLGERGIFTWDGNYYAINLAERLGVQDSGGMLRIGLTHYNTAEEVERLLEELRRMAKVGVRQLALIAAGIAIVKFVITSAAGAPVECRFCTRWGGGARDLLFSSSTNSRFLRVQTRDARNDKLLVMSRPSSLPTSPPLIYNPPFCGGAKECAACLAGWQCWLWSR